MTCEASASQAFQAIWGKAPFGYQLEVTERLLAGRNVVLAAPTGSGKTLAALHPFVRARQDGLAWADRLLYTLPLRTLTSALHEKYGSKLAQAGLKASLQTGLYKGDPAFRGDVCFATIDQVLSAYVGQPISLGEGQANLVGGALVGAYLVFDEFHLLEPERALATALDLAKRLRGFTRLLFMTATATQPVLDHLAAVLEADVVTPSAEDLKKMPAQSTRRRTYAWFEGTLTADAVLARRRDRTIVVVNTVKRAQTLYDELRKKLETPERQTGEKGADPGLLLLHSRFLAEDRQAIEKLALSIFAKDSQQKGLLIATQVVEVGLDISAQVLLTELAPANSLVQRAGRCARFADQVGEVVVFEAGGTEAEGDTETEAIEGATATGLESEGTEGDGATARRRYRPYTSTDCLATRRGLAGRLAGGPVVADYQWELSLVEEALGEPDRAAIGYLIAHAGARREDIGLALAQNPKAAYRRFVRSVDATAIVIHANPGELDLRRGVDTFSVSDPVLRGFVRDLDLAGALAGLVQYPEWNDDPHQENASPVRRWAPVESLRNLRGQFLLAVSPEVASYDPTLGLRLGQAGAWQSGQERRPAGEVDQGDVGKGKVKRKVVGVAETFRQHALDVARRARDLAASEAVAARAHLGAVLGCSAEAFLDLIELVGVLHDLGKLDQAWQDGIWRIQSASGGPERVRAQEGSGRFLAHSDRLAPAGHGGPTSHLPPHSVAGACVSFPVLRAFVGRTFPLDLGDTILAAALAAIARHHYPWSAEFRSFQGASGVREELAAIFEGIGRTEGASMPAAVSPRNGSDLMASVLKGAHPSNPKVWALYWLIVRLLRLADQASQADLAALAGV